MLAPAGAPAVQWLGPARPPVLPLRPGGVLPPAGDAAHFKGAPPNAAEVVQLPAGEPNPSELPMLEDVHLISVEPGSDVEAIDSGDPIEAPAAAAPAVPSGPFAVFERSPTPWLNGVLFGFSPFGQMEAPRPPSNPGAPVPEALQALNVTPKPG